MSDESRIRELSELIRAKCAQQQMRQQQQQVGTPATQPPVSGGSVTAVSSAVTQHNTEIRRKLKEVIVRLQEEVRDPSLSGIQQRLKYTASKFGLTFNIQRLPNGIIMCYLSSESFYIEINLQDNGTIESTTLNLGQDNQQNSELLTTLLCQHDYQSFETHLKALLDMFGQSSGQESSSSLLKVMFTIENILLTIYNPNNGFTIKDTILLTDLGHVTPRRTGLPMELTFFVTPFEALKHPFLQDLNTSTELLQTKVGVSAKVQVERSTQLYRLPVDPNLFNRSQASFYSITEQNSVLVHLTLVLCLSEDIPVCAAILEKLQQDMYGSVQSLPQLTTPHIDQLILMDETKDNPVDNSYGTTNHTIYLPGQVHEYTGLCGTSNEVLNAHRGVLLPNRKVPFNHPRHVIKIIHLLRQQLVYNNLLKSCLRRKKMINLTSLDLKEISLSEDYTFVVSTFPPEKIELSTNLLTTDNSTTKLTIEFHIPQENSPPTQPVVRLKVAKGQLEQYKLLDNILAECLSIPVTVHSVFSQTDKIFSVPSLVAEAIKDHKLALSKFNHQLMSHEDVSCDLMEVSKSDVAAGGGGMLPTGIKRKRIIE